MARSARRRAETSASTSAEPSYCSEQLGSSVHSASDSCEQSGAVPVQSDFQLQPCCPVQLMRPGKLPHESALPEQFLLPEDQKQPAIAVHEYTLNWL